MDTHTCSRKRSARRKAAAFLVAMALGGWPLPPASALEAQARTPDAEPTVLTLTEALARASEHNPEYRRALNLIELEAPRQRMAWGAFLPDLTLSYGTGQAVRREESWVDFEGNPVANPNVRSVGSSYANQSVFASLDLFGGGSRFRALDEARALARSLRFSAERDLNRILADVRRQFLLVQRWKARVLVEETLLSAREGDFERSRRLLELSMVDRSDLLGAELDLEEQRSALIEAQGMVDKSRLALRAAIGDPLLSTPDPERQIVEAFDPNCLNLSLLVERALRENPEVGEAEATVSVSEAALRARRASRWPTLTLFSSLNRQAYGADGTALFDVNPGGFSGSLGFNVSIPVFDRFQTTRAIADASVELRNARETIRQATLQLEQRIRATHVDLTTAWAMFRERSRRREIADERLRMVREAYELETKTIEDLRAAIRDQAVALRDESDQRFDFAVALVELHEAAGIVAREAGLGGDGPREALHARCGSGVEPVNHPPGWTPALTGSPRNRDRP